MAALGAQVGDGLWRPSMSDGALEAPGRDGALGLPGGGWG